MIDIDIITNLDPTTGVPTVDDLSTAQRWLDAMHHCPPNYGATNSFSHPHKFGQVGVDQTKDNKPALLTSAHNQNNE